MEKVDIRATALSLEEFWSQKIVGEANGNLFKIAKGIGSTTWHKHDDEEEVFFVYKGHLTIQLRTGNIDLNEGDMFIVPRSVSAGNFKLCGVMLAYASAAVAPVMKRGMGWNFVPDELGRRIMDEINELVLSKRVRPVIGHVADFEDLPAAIEALAKRETVGRTIVRLW